MRTAKRIIINNTEYIRADSAKTIVGKKKKMQFSQKMTVVSSVFSMAIVVVVLIANFVLLILGKQPMEQETITTITVYGGLTSTLTLGGYLALSGVRDCSKNKHGIKETEKEE